MKYDVERIAYRKQQVAPMLGICLRSIDNMIADKQLTAGKFGSSVAFAVTAIYPLMSSPLAVSSGTVCNLRG